MATNNFHLTPLLRSAHLGLWLWALLVGLSFPAVGLISEGLPPLLLTACRFAIAALALGCFLDRGNSPWPDLPALTLYLGLGLCLSLFFAAVFWAAHRLSALSMATLYVSVPLLSYCLGRGMGVEPPAIRMLAILALGAAGALGLGWAEAFARAGELTTAKALPWGWAELVFFGGCLASAGYPVLSKWGLQKQWLPPQASVRTFWSLVTGSLLLSFMGLFWETPVALARITVSDMLLLIYLGVFSSAATFWLQQRATTVLTPGAVTAYSYLIPFVSMVLLWIRQPLAIDWSWLPGSALVLLAITLLLRHDRHNHGAVPASRAQQNSPSPDPMQQQSGQGLSTLSHR